MGRRLNWIDYAKGLIIIALVFGHALSSGKNAGLPISPSFTALWHATLSNMIPLFFFLAGVFVPRSYETRSPRAFAIERVQRVAYPYFVWSVLQAVVVIAFAQPHSRTGYDTLLAIPYRPFDQFWFLYALVWMAPLYALCRQVGGWSSAALAMLSIVLFLFPIRTPIFGLELLSIHLIFFSAGALASRYIVGDRQLPELPIWASLIALAAFVGSSLYIYTHWLDAESSHVTYRGYYLALGVLAGVGTVGLAQFLSHRRGLGLLEFLGKYSLHIFVAHMFGVVGARVIAQSFLGIGDPYVIIGAGIVAGLAGPVVLALLTERLGLPSLFELPTKKRPKRPAPSTDGGRSPTTVG
jgi:fucose 4-O-acetylase-like acetyltransferase